MIDDAAMGAHVRDALEELSTAAMQWLLVRRRAMALGTVPPALSVGALLGILRRATAEIDRCTHFASSQEDHAP